MDRINLLHIILPSNFILISPIDSSFRIEDDDNNEGNAFLTEYSIKYLGCASVSQWNNNNGNDGEFVLVHYVSFLIHLIRFWFD